MITFILTATEDAEALARLLSALVPAVAEGLVREAAVVGARGAAAEVADDAGADLCETFGAAIEAARGPWIAGAPLGAVFTPDWMQLVADHVRREPMEAARLASRGFGLRQRAGWLVPKRLAPSAVVVEQDLQRLARRGRRLRVLEPGRGGR
ncbi:MAG TPA: hypothetical protein VGF50_08380 [Caulobacteraceae bacterium]